jgi:ABC-type nitrate/sulfonate/bicarbonate transport system substrate-binding protein
MSKFRVATHGRLQEWVAEEKGYFKAEGLDYEFEVYAEMQQSWGGPSVGGEVKYGAYESFQDGRACEISSACHWATNQAGSSGHGRMWGHAYSVTPSGIYVAPESAVRRPNDLNGVEIGVGYHSGSHFSTLQMLDPFIPAKDVQLKFIGRPSDRLNALVDRDIPAANVFGAQQYVAEQFGFRKVVDTTFMIGFLIAPDADLEDVDRYFKALRSAQRDIDLEPERYKHYLMRELPRRYHDQVDANGFGPGERVVFEPYTREMFERTHRWMAQVQIFSEEELGKAPYEEAVLA